MKLAPTTTARHPSAQDSFLHVQLDDVLKLLARKTRVLAVGDVGAVSLRLAQRGCRTTAVLGSTADAQVLRRIASGQEISLDVKAASPSSYRIRGSYDLIIMNDCLRGLDSSARSAAIAELKAHTRVGGYHLMRESLCLLSDTAEDINSIMEKEVFGHYADWLVLHQSNFVNRSDHAAQPTEQRVVRLVATRRPRSS